METETCFTCDCEQGRFCHDIGAGYAIETCNPLWCECRKSQSWREKCDYKIAGRLEPRRPPMKDEGTETTFRLDQCKHFRKSKHLLRSEVNRCDQSRIELHLRRSTTLAKKKRPLILCIKSEHCFYHGISKNQA